MSNLEVLELEQKLKDRTGEEIRYLEFDTIFKEIYSKHAKSFLTAIDDFKKLKDDVFETKAGEMSVGIKSKTVIYDVHIECIKSQYEFDVEMQKENPEYPIEERMLHYFSVLLSKSMKKGKTDVINDRYFDKECYVVVYLGFNLFKDERYCHIQRFVDVTDNHYVYKGKIIYFCLPNYKNCDNIELRRYLEILQSTNLEVKEGDDANMIYLIDDAKVLLENDEKKIEAIKRQMIIEDYELQKEIAHFKGKEEGKLEVAKQMLADGVDVELISKYTNMSIEEINSL